MQVFRTGEAFEKPHAFRHHPDLALHFDRMRRKVQPEKVHASRGWCKQAGEHLNGRGFARTIRPEETEELAGGNLEVDAVNGGEVPESAGQPLRANGYFGHSVSVERSGLPRWKTLTRVARGLARMPSKAGPFKRVCADSILGR